MEVIHNKNKLGLNTERKIYACSVCYKLFNWGNESYWYGSIKQMDLDPSKLTFACSEKCKIKHEKTIT